MLKEIGTWYFEWGYLITCIIGLIGGTQCKNTKHMLIWIITLLGLGFVMAYLKTS